MRATRKINERRSGVDPADDYNPTGAPRSITRILQEIVNRTTEIFRSEIRLATTEVRKDVLTWAKAAVYLIIAGALTLYALGFLLLGVVYALQIALPAWSAAVVVGAVVGIIAAGLFFIGRKKIRRASLRPDKTIQTLEENATWIKKQTG